MPFPHDALHCCKQLGGRCTSYVDDKGFRFDTGPSLLLFPDVYRDSFAALGTTLQQHVDVRKIQPAAYRVHFAPATAAAEGKQQKQGAAAGRRASSLDLLYDVEAMADQLEQVEAGAGESGGVQLTSFCSTYISSTQHVQYHMYHMHVV
jgi:phytoene desaturase (3,4-didehydrolycopene-forming)